MWKLDRLPIKQYLNRDDDSSCPGNSWTVETGSLEDSYPFELAELLVRMTDVLPGSIIFDAYMGTSAALQACLKLGHSFYGFESDHRKLTKYKKIVQDHQSKEKS